ncbi:protein INVOLVED IN DE NOVO 2-like [Bidens hawaiensis]|uniref:protein INVOLVED IN DE NOVO 2-like n=1 Tax=Bidens hawaiensis TaxID=980011 RepID=UPI00404A64E2
MGLVEYLEKDFDTKVILKSFDSTSKSLLDTTQKQNAKEDVYVWPWMAVVANIHVEYKNGKYVGDSGSKLKEDWTGKGYKPEKVHTLWNYKGHTGLAVVGFGSTWDGLCHVLMFMKDFEVNKHGREDWFSREINGKDDKLYAWIATDKDYNSFGLVGSYLKKNGNLKTVADIQKQEVIELKLFMGLKAIIDGQDKRSEEINVEISKTDSELKSVVKQKEEMTENFNRDMEMMQKKANEQLKVITAEHERSKWLLEDREKKLRAREVKNDDEKRKLDNEKRMVLDFVLHARLLLLLLKQ